jgi:hypothetical protein
VKVSEVALVCAVISCVIVFAPGASPVSAATPPVTGGPIMLAHNGHAVADDTGGTPTTTSDNWAGYLQEASVKHTFTEVTDTIVVPTAVTPTAGTQYGLDWVGVDGFSVTPNSQELQKLIQAGVEYVVSTVNGQSSVRYFGWTEVLPHDIRPLPISVAAGDSVTLTVQEVAKNKWQMVVDDVTTGVSRSRTVRHRLNGLTAEAIHERPCIEITQGCNELAQLAQTSPVTFDPGYFSMTAPGVTPILDPLLGRVPQAALIAVAMVSSSNGNTTVIAAPSDSNAANDGFAVADGSTSPPPPNF